MLIFKEYNTEDSLCQCDSDLSLPTGGSMETSTTQSLLIMAYIPEGSNISLDNVHNVHNTNVNMPQIAETGGTDVGHSLSYQDRLLDLASESPQDSTDCGRSKPGDERNVLSGQNPGQMTDRPQQMNLNCEYLPLDGGNQLHTPLLKPGGTTGVTSKTPMTFVNQLLTPTTPSMYQDKNLSPLNVGKVQATKVRGTPKHKGLMQPPETPVSPMMNHRGQHSAPVSPMVNSRGLHSTPVSPMMNHRGQHSIPVSPMMSCRGQHSAPVSPMMNCRGQYSTPPVSPMMASRGQYNIPPSSPMRTTTRGQHSAPPVSPIMIGRGQHSTPHTPVHVPVSSTPVTPSNVSPRVVLRYDDISNGLKKPVYHTSDSEPSSPSGAVFKNISKNLLPTTPQRAVQPLKTQTVTLEMERVTDSQKVVIRHEYIDQYPGMTQAQKQEGYFEENKDNVNQEMCDDQKGFSSHEKVENDNSADSPMADDEDEESPGDDVTSSSFVTAATTPLAQLSPIMSVESDSPGSTLAEDLQAGLEDVYSTLEKIAKEASQEAQKAANRDYYSLQSSYQPVQYPQPSTVCWPKTTVENQPLPAFSELASSIGTTPQWDVSMSVNAYSTATYSTSYSTNYSTSYPGTTPACTTVTSSQGLVSTTQALNSLPHDATHIQAPNTNYGALQSKYDPFLSTDRPSTADSPGWYEGSLMPPSLSPGIAASATAPAWQDYYRYNNMGGFANTRMDEKLKRCHSFDSGTGMDFDGENVEYDLMKAGLAGEPKAATWNPSTGMSCMMNSAAMSQTQLDLNLPPVSSYQDYKSAVLSGTIQWMGNPSVGASASVRPRTGTAIMSPQTVQMPAPLSSLSGASVLTPGGTLGQSQGGAGMQPLDGTTGSQAYYVQSIQPMGYQYQTAMLLPTYLPPSTSPVNRLTAPGNTVYEQLENKRKLESANAYNASKKQAFGGNVGTAHWSGVNVPPPMVHSNTTPYGQYQQCSQPQYGQLAPMAQQSYPQLAPAAQQYQPPAYQYDPLPPTMVQQAPSTQQYVATSQQYAQVPTYQTRPMPAKPKVDISEGVIGYSSKRPNKKLVFQVPKDNRNLIGEPRLYMAPGIKTETKLKLERSSSTDSEESDTADGEKGEEMTMQGLKTSENDTAIQSTTGSMKKLDLGSNYPYFNITDTRKLLTEVGSSSGGGVVHSSTGIQTGIASTTDTHQSTESTAFITPVKESVQRSASISPVEEVPSGGTAWPPSNMVWPRHLTPAGKYIYAPINVKPLQSHGYMPGDS